MRSLVFMFLVSVQVNTFADDQEQLDSIYRLFMKQTIDIKSVEQHYAENVIHVSMPNQPLLIGKKDFLNMNILPVAAMIDEGNMTVKLKAYVVRRVIKSEMANDVGYLYFNMTTQDNKSIEQVRKFSWVFLKRANQWRVLTDFDSVPAPMSVLENINDYRLIE